MAKTSDINASNCLWRV